MQVSKENKTTENEEIGQGEKIGLVSKIGWFLFISFFVILLTFMGVKAIRNRDAFELGKRFLRHNEVIKQQTGGVLEIRGMKGKKGVNTWELAGKAKGKEKNLQFIIQVYCGDGMSDSGSFCTVSRAKYRNDVGLLEMSRNDDIMPHWDAGGWNEIEVSWIDSALLVFGK
jgi:hypothetical protein